MLTTPDNKASKQHVRRAHRQSTERSGSNAAPANRKHTPQPIATGVPESSRLMIHADVAQTDVQLHVHVA